MMDLTQEQKEFITSKQEEYHQFSTKINLLENEASELRVLRREKLDECETAKDEYNSANRAYWANQNILDDNKIEFVNRGEIKHIFSINKFTLFILITKLHINSNIVQILISIICL